MNESLVNMVSTISWLSRSLLYKVVTKHLYCRKLCSNWVPKLLTHVLKMKCMEATMEFLAASLQKKIVFFRRVVTGEGMWVCLWLQKGTGTEIAAYWFLENQKSSR